MQKREYAHPIGALYLLNENTKNYEEILEILGKIGSFAMLVSLSFDTLH